MHHHEVKSLIVGEKFVEAEALISHSLRELDINARSCTLLNIYSFLLFLTSFSSVADLCFGMDPDLTNGS